MAVSGGGEGNGGEWFRKQAGEEVARGLIGGKGRLGRRKTSQMELLKA